MKTVSACLRLAPVLAALCAFLPASSHAARPGAEIVRQLAPHKATYDIRMSSRHSGSPVLDIRGSMTFEARAGCDAWMTRHNFDLQYDYAESAPMKLASAFVVHEPYDGRSLDFSTRRSRDGILYEELRGHASLDRKGGGRAVYTRPADLVMDLKDNTYFPSNHTAALAQAIQDKKKFFSAIIFDGSDTEGPVEINSVIGGPAARPASQSPEIDAALVAAPAWNVRMAFFPLNADAEQAESDYEMDVVFHENGVIGTMLIDYGDFSMTQKLVRLEQLAPEPCVSGKNQPKSKP